MNYTKKSKISLSISAALLSISMLSVTALMPSQKAEAGIPITDPAALAQMIQQGIARVMDSEIMQTLTEAGLDLQAMLSEMEVDTINNAFANMIARTNAASTEIQNLEQIERAQPAQDACETIELSVNMSDMICNFDSQRNASNAKSKISKAMARGNGTAECDGDTCVEVVNEAPSVDQISRYNQTVAKQHIVECEALSGQAGYDVCADTSLISMSPPGGLNAPEYKAVIKMNEVAAGVIAQLPRTEAQSNDLKGQPVYYQMQALDQRDAYYNEVFKASNDLNVMLREGTIEADGVTRLPGEIINLDRYLTTRLGSQNWLCEISNVSGDACKTATNPDGEPTYVPPAELDKRKAQMEAVSLYIGLQQYKSMLRIERLIADTALMKLDPPGKPVN